MKTRKGRGRRTGHARLQKRTGKHANRSKKKTGKGRERKKSKGIRRSVGKREKQGKRTPERPGKRKRTMGRARRVKVRPFAGIWGMKTSYEYPRKERTELLRRVQALRRRVGVEE